MPTFSCVPRQPGSSVKLASWVRQHPYTLATAVILLIYLISYVTSTRSGWDDVYLQASRRMLAGENIFGYEGGYAYPPCRALFMTPFLLLQPWAQRAAWWACNAVCLVWLCRGAWRLTGGAALEGSAARPWHEHMLWLAGLVTGVFYVFNSLSNQATDVIEAALLVAGCLALSADREFRAAVWFGLAAAMKATPLLWAAYLVWKGRWRAAGLLAVVAVGVNLLPDLVRPCPTASTWLGAWYAQYLAPMQQTNYAPGDWGSTVYYNQSLAGMVNRLFLSEWTWTADGMAIRPQAYPPAAALLKFGLLAFEALLVAVCALGWWRRGRPNAPTASAGLQASLEYSLVCLLMLLLSPMSSKSHFSTLLVPGFALARVAWERRSGLTAALLLAANLFGVCALNWWGDYVSLISLYYGAITIKALLLLAGCCAALTLLRRPAASSSTARTPATASADDRFAA